MRWGWRGDGAERPSRTRRWEEQNIFNCLIFNLALWRDLGVLSILTSKVSRVSRLYLDSILMGTGQPHWPELTNSTFLSSASAFLSLFLLCLVSSCQRSPLQDLDVNFFLRFGTAGTSTNHQQISSKMCQHLTRLVIGFGSFSSERGDFHV